MMVLDDVQWADGASLDVCRWLAASAAHLPLLLVLASRPVPHGSGTGRLLAALRGRDTISISLGPLDPAAIRDLVSEVAGAPPSPELVELVGQAMGNPLYVRELVESLVRGYALTDLPSRPPPESQEFYRLGLEPVHDLGWIVTLADPAWSGVESA